MGEEQEVVDDSAGVFEAHSKDAFCVDCTDRWVVTGGEDDTAAVFSSNSLGFFLKLCLFLFSSSCWTA